jgi:hypothetical protein
MTAPKVRKQVPQPLPKNDNFLRDLQSLIIKFLKVKKIEALAKLLKPVENCHSGQAKRDPESSPARSGI